MKVIILEDDRIKDVKDGFARNYLLPRKLAVPATQKAIAQMEKRKVIKEAEVAKHEVEANELAERINSATISVQTEAGEKDKLFGSIGTREIAEALKEQAGIELERKKIVLPDPIKILGEYKIGVKLFHGIAAEINLSIKKK